jgi:hypothetical protein
MSEPRATIRTYALVAVSLTSLALIGFAWWLIGILAGRDWCDRAIGAAKDATRPESAVAGCFTLLHQQVLALSVNSYIALGTLALCLAVLVVIVIAGGKLSFKASATGVEADVGHDPNDAAQFVADKAQGAADQVKGTP